MFQSKTLAITAIITALGCGQLFADQSLEEKAREAGLPWKPGQLHATYEDHAQVAFVDVNDDFLIESTKRGDQTVLRIAVTDGMRSKYLTCSDAAQNIKPGERRTTWLEISYSPPDKEGYRDYSITRTADFAGHTIVNHFRSNGDLGYALLGDGTVAEINNGNIAFSQMSGPIGFSGNTKELRVTTIIGAEFGNLSATVQMNSRSWSVHTIRGADGTPISFDVNGASVQPYFADTKRPLESAPIIVTAPVTVDRMSSFVLRVAYEKDTLLEKNKKTSTLKEIKNVTHQMLAGPLPCTGQPCLNSSDCRIIGGSTCYCHPSSGGVPGLCLI